MMYNRYGRHGPKAWLRRRNRRYMRPSVLPVPVAPSSLVRLFVPATTERIIVIIMSDGNPQEVFEMNERVSGNMTLIPGRHVDQESSELQRISARQLTPIQNLADYAAYRDVETIRHILANGQTILFDQGKFAELVEKHAQDDITKDDIRMSPSGYVPLLLEYKTAYQRSFDEKVQPYAQKIIRDMEELEQQFRARVCDDRLLVENRTPGDWHARDLVVVRWIQTYYPHTVQEIDDAVLLDHHEFLDRYTNFIFDTEGRSEVKWPDQDSFRP